MYHCFWSQTYFVIDGAMLSNVYTIRYDLMIIYFIGDNWYFIQSVLIPLPKLGGCIEIFYHRLSYSYFLMASITNQMIKGQSILYKNMYMYLHMHRFQLYSIGTCISTSLRAESWKRNVPTVFVLFIWMLWYYWGCDWFFENFTTSIILIVLLLSALHVYQTQTPILIKIATCIPFILMYWCTLTIM